MSIPAITKTGFDFLLKGLGAVNRSAAPLAGADFHQTLLARLTDFKSQALSTLGGAVSAAGTERSASGLEALLTRAGSAGGLSPTGRNMSLFDPESGFRMMSDINRRDVTYKAEFAEMGDLKSAVAAMQKQGASLAEVDASSSDAEILGRLQGFVQAYNGWIDRFDEALAEGGLLAGTQAAKVSQRALETSVENIFNGARDGVRGMGDLGISIDPVTNMASLDVSKLNGLLAGNRKGVINAIDEFSANFARSAELLNSAGNFIPNRLNNLARVISYLDENKASLQAEFGTGEAARPNGQVAKALAAYQAMTGTATSR